MKEKQLSYRFNQFRKAQPNVGHYIILSTAIRGMNYIRGKVTHGFNKHVSKEDYASDERDMLLESLWEVTKLGEAYKIPLFLATEKN